MKSWSIYKIDLQTPGLLWCLIYLDDFLAYREPKESDFSNRLSQEVAGMLLLVNLTNRSNANTGFGTLIYAKGASNYEPFGSAKQQTVHPNEQQWSFDLKSKAWTSHLNFHFPTSKLYQTRTLNLLTS